MTIRKKILQIRELIWFHSPRFLHKVDYFISEKRFNYGIYFPYKKNRGLRYFKRKLFYLNPLEINFYDSERYFSSFYYVQSGDWDLRKDKIENKIQYTIVKELIELNLELNQLSCFEKLVEKKMRSNLTYKEAINVLEGQYSQLKKIFLDIKKNGYKSQLELNNTSENRFNTWFDEMRVSVGRNGEFILSGSGNHRLMMARLLKIKTVPVIIVRIHRDFYLKNPSYFE